MIWTIFKTFFLLGCTSFGGPAAHLGYFRQHFVQRLEWVNEDQYAQWIAISQVMPGPGSSQVGFAIGCHQAGLTGGIAAFVGFTLPSVILMCLFALFGALFIDSLWFANVVSALKLMAVVIVADAALGMYRAFCTTLALKVAALIGGTFVLVWPFGLAGLYLVIGAVLLGALLPSRGKSEPTSQRKPALRQANVLLLLFIGMLLLSATVEASGILGMMAEFYQSGSFVFGGGHVVLPLINEFVSGDVSTTQVLTGYAVAQAVPGPMFTIATILGQSPHQLDKVFSGGERRRSRFFYQGFC